jgi:hypothetical protein
MTDRPEGTSRTDGPTPPDEDDVSPPHEPEAGGAAVEPVPASAEEPGADLGDDIEAPEVEPEEPETPEEPEAPGTEPGPTETAPAGAATPARRREGAAQPAPRAPTPSELAVRVKDPASTIFVVGTAVVFIGILLYGLLLGEGGTLTPIPTPGPTPSITAEPSGSGSPAPSVSSAPSASVAPSASATPVASQSAAPSATPSAQPSASPS